MHLYKNLFLLPAMLVLFLSCAPRPVEQSAEPVKKVKEPGVSYMTSMDMDILRYINHHRQALGLPVLETLAAATEQAYSHSRNMATGRTAFSHDGFDERIQQIRKNFGFISASAENVAYGQLTAKEVVDGWLRSPGHKRNIEGDYRYTGIGSYRNKKGILYFTQIFLRR